ncbi:MAG: hypothetical protein RIR10_1470, partial [Planctomycetota bacterium]
AKLVAAQMQREMAAGGAGVPGAGASPGVVGSIGMGAPGSTSPATGSTTKSGLIIPD